MTATPKRVVVLGGTGCGGRAIVATARARGHLAWSVARGTATAPDIVCDRHATELGAIVHDLAPDVFVDHTRPDPTTSTRCWRRSPAHAATCS